MSRSPLPPAGKRMKTSDESDDEEIIIGHYPTRDPPQLALFDSVFSSPGGSNPMRAEVEVRFFDPFPENDHLEVLEEDNSDISGDGFIVDDDSEDEDENDEGGLINEYYQYYPGDLEDEEGRDLYYVSGAEDEIDRCLSDEYLKHDPTPDTQYPKPDWITVQELRQRKYGIPSSNTTSVRSSNMYWFEKNARDSLWMIQRLELTKRLEGHNGSVNSLNFNHNGNLICSGSADLGICIWDWQSNKLKKKIITGHRAEIFHSQFCNSDASIITSSQDGTVRLLDVETGLSERLLAQSGHISKLDFITPQTLVTCGTNACVNFIDLRTKESTKLFIVRNPNNNRSCALHSINVHPIDKHKIVVGGDSSYVFLYDLRRVARTHQIGPIDRHHTEQKPTCCLDIIKETGNVHEYAVTSTAFNSMGDKLLVSYNDDDLYVCQMDTCEVIHRYKGHRNKKTIKGCCWFGDNYVLSGSDDGHIYGWDLHSEHIVCFLKGDMRGSVNCLSVHPTMPVLASSGFDHNVKVYEPISRIWPQTLKGIKPQICKNTMRRKRSNEMHDQFRRMFAGRESDDN